MEEGRFIKHSRENNQLRRSSYVIEDANHFENETVITYPTNAIDKRDDLILLQIA